MGRKPEKKIEEVEIFDKKFIAEFEKRYKDDLQLAELSFSDESYLRHYLWGRGFEFALELAQREFCEK